MRVLLLLQLLLLLLLLLLLASQGGERAGTRLLSAGATAGAEAGHRVEGPTGAVAGVLDIEATGEWAHIGVVGTGGIRAAGAIHHLLPGGEAMMGMGTMRTIQVLPGAGVGEGVEVVAGEGGDGEIMQIMLASMITSAADHLQGSILQRQQQCRWLHWQIWPWVAWLCMAGQVWLLLLLAGKGMMGSIMKRGVKKSSSSRLLILWHSP